jgi:coenzyme F420-reducing hydrogenase alpha subunit
MEEVKAITLWDHLRNITTAKGEYMGDEGWNNYMVNRFLSMHREYCDVVNYVQKNTWQMKGEYLYTLYKDIIPKQYVRFNYVKATKKKEYKIEELEAVQTYFEVSKKEAKEYINMLPEDELNNIISQINGKS